MPRDSQSRGLSVYGGFSHGTVQLKANLAAPSLTLPRSAGEGNALPDPRPSHGRGTVSKANRGEGSRTMHPEIPMPRQPADP